MCEDPKTVIKDKLQANSERKKKQRGRKILELA